MTQYACATDIIRDQKWRTVCNLVIEIVSKLSITGCCIQQENIFFLEFASNTDYRRPEKKQPSLHGQKFNPNPKFLGTAKAYFVSNIGPIFQIQQGLEIHGLKECGPWRCTVFNWFPKHLRYAVFSPKALKMHVFF